jgi:hypothetical protein
MGTDQDSDPLTYTVRYSTHPLQDGPTVNVTTTDEFFDLSNLPDNATHHWTVDAFDGRSNSTDVPTEVWSFTVCLSLANIPVRFSSTPPTFAWVGQVYAYNLTSMDEDGDIPAYSIMAGPPAMDLDPRTGKLRWTPMPSDIGNHTIFVRVEDGRGSFDNQTFTITVKEIPPPPVILPKCAVIHPANRTTVNGTIHVTGTAMNGSAPLYRIRVRIDNGTWSAAAGLENWTFKLDTAKLSNGRHIIEARSYAANLSSETASVIFIVNNPDTSVSTGSNYWCLPAILICVMAGIAIIAIYKKRASH